MRLLHPLDGQVSRRTDLISLVVDRRVVAHRGRDDCCIFQPVIRCDSAYDSRKGFSREAKMWFFSIASEF